jgi:RNA polymerase sigma factor (sigma-70 family)
MEAHSFARSDGGLTLPRSRKLLAAFGDERLVAQLRRGNDQAFEVLYDRHHAAVLSYCRHMLGSRDEAEDALQQAFVSAHADIVSTDKPIRFKAWIYTIARNRCLSILRARREQPTDDLERVSTAGLGDEVQRRADLQELLSDMHELPEDQRAALILSELGDLSHAEVAEVIECEVTKVKSLVFQARAGLIERRQARETPCREIREQLATLKGGSLRRGPLRRHLKACPGCSEFRDDVRRQRQMVAAVLPVVPTLALRDNALAAVGIGASSAGGGVLAGGGAGAVIAAKAGVVKVAVIAVATTGTIGGAVALEQSVGGGGSHRGGNEQSEAAAQGGAAGTAAEAGGTNGLKGTEVRGDLDGAGDGHAYGKGGVGAEHKNGFEPVQGGSNGERAREFAGGRGNGNHQGLNALPVAHGGSHPHAGPKPKQNPVAPKTERPGPQNDQPKPNPKPELTPFLPAVPDLTPPDSQRGARMKATQDSSAEQPRADDTETQP